jgi:glycosyltransferase involved in cell wall biosynthesis
MVNLSDTKRYTILAPGFAKWWGSDPRALAQSFRALGHNVLEIDAEDYVPWRWCGLLPRVLRRLFTWMLVDDYNRAVIKQAESCLFDFILVFKGMYLKESTISFLRSFGKPVYNFYPDVSYTDHGSFIPSALQHYDCAFTTKSFHGKKEIETFRIRNIVHVRHGFDPEVHRPVRLSPAQIEHYGCDVSFVGCWSPEKERLILHILVHRSNIKVVVYGIGWKYAGIGFRKALGKNLRPGAFGDELAIIYNASKVNLGLLSRAAGDPSMADQTTARTFQIPASGSVMLHEDTLEVRSYFEPEKEIMLFKGESDLLMKLDRLLSDDALRASIRENGHQRCMKESYGYSSAAEAIVKKFEARTA